MRHPMEPTSRRMEPTVYRKLRRSIRRLQRFVGRSDGLSDGSNAPSGDRMAYRMNPMLRWMEPTLHRKPGTPSDGSDGPSDGGKESFPRSNVTLHGPTCSSPDRFWRLRSAPPKAGPGRS